MLFKEKITPPLEVNKVMGFRKRDAIKILLRKFSTVNGNEEMLIEKIHSSFTRSMIRYYQSSSTLQPLPSAESIFQQLRNEGIHVALNTGFTKPITDAILHRLEWNGNVVDAVISSDEVAEGRPSPDMIFELMRRFQVNDPAAVIKVGDTAVDILKEGMLLAEWWLALLGAYSRKNWNPAPDHIIDNLRTPWTH
jgi:phosphonatase-like hydrolase